MKECKSTKKDQPACTIDDALQIGDIERKNCKKLKLSRIEFQDRLLEIVGNNNRSIQVEFSTGRMMFGEKFKISIDGNTITNEQLCKLIDFKFEACFNIDLSVTWNEPNFF